MCVFFKFPNIEVTEQIKNFFFLQQKYRFIFLIYFHYICQISFLIYLDINNRQIEF